MAKVQLRADPNYRAGRGPVWVGWFAGPYSGAEWLPILLHGFFISFIRALLVSGSPADPQAGQGASAGRRAPPRAGPPRAGGHLLRAADGVPVEGAGRHRLGLRLDSPPS